MVRRCSRKGCKQLFEAKGLCEQHYKIQYLRKYGRTNMGRFVALRRAAKVLGLQFNITPEFHVLLLSKPCKYCKGKLSPTGHGIDRKDSSKGYTMENAVPCCVMCNRIKNCYLTYEEMKAAMKAVLKVRKQNGTK